MRNTVQTLKAIKAAIVATLIVITVGCGYSSKNYTPVAGNMPAIAALSPTSVNHGSAAFLLTINGSKFNSNAVVNWNTAAQSGATYVGTGQLTIMIPASMVATSGTAQVTVTNPANPGGGMYGSGGTTAETSNSITFTIN